MKNITPEVMLKNFNRKAFQLLKGSTVLNNEKIETGLKEFLRKTLIAEILFERYVIAVSGLQGVGKTTLIKQVYDIPEGIIPENLGRGEKLPVLITECEQDGYTTFVRKFQKRDNEYEIVEEEVESNQFLKLAREPDSDHILLELKVPVKKGFFENENKSFVLLPGFEKITRENSLWQNLIQHTLTCSATCIFVFNETKFADGDNKVLLEKIQDVFKIAKPLFVLSWSDASKDKNQGLKNQVKERYNISDNEQDRIVCTGTKKIFGIEWIEELKKSVHKYSATQRDFRKIQRENLDVLLINEFGNLLTGIKTDKVKIRIEGNAQRAKLDELIQPLTIEIERIRNKYATITKDSLDAYAQKPIQQARQHIADKDWFDKLKEMFIGKSLQDKINFENLIRDLWENANGYSPLEAQAYVLNELLSRQFGLHGQLPFDKGNVDKQKLLGTYEESGDKEYRFDENTSNDFEILMSNKNTERLKVSRDYARSMKLVPLLALDLQRIGTIFPEFFDLENKIISSKEHIDQTVGTFDFLSTTKGKIIAAIGMELGIDAAFDGKIDTIPNLVKALGFSAGGLASQVATATAGALGIGMLAASVITQINKMEIQDAGIATDMILSIRDKYYAHYMVCFDSTMNYLVEFIQNRLIQYYHLDEFVAKEANLLKAIADAVSARDEMREILQDENIVL
ncbi:MAG: hypothetical protein KGZ58_09965 [Ignavibacteriales bacterium]|nr:hypothetical protein [Ignavibacteriales bacterium]